VSNLGGSTENTSQFMRMCGITDDVCGRGVCVCESRGAPSTYHNSDRSLSLWLKFDHSNFKIELSYLVSKLDTVCQLTLGSYTLVMSRVVTEEFPPNSTSNTSRIQVCERIPRITLCLTSVCLLILSHYHRRRTKTHFTKV
jgi:hypothetical protein